VPSPGPNFSPFPFEHLQRYSRREAALTSVLARWIVVRPLGERTAQLAGGPVTVERHAIHAAGSRASIDPHAAIAEIRLAGLSLLVALSSRPIRGLAQRLLGGPAELAAARPLTSAEHAIGALLLAAAIEDLGLPAEVWPLAELDPDLVRDSIQLELGVDLAGTPLTLVALCPPDLELRVPPPRPLPGWKFYVPVVVGSCAIPRETLTRLEVRDVITIEPGLALRFGEGAIGLAASPGAVEAKVVTGYVPRDMALPDDAHVELTVQLGTTRVTLRQLAELAPGAIVSLGRPLSGPFEVRAAGRLLGQGELVDVDGEVGVRIVSLQE
jgi:type III secretion protein Q